MFSIRLGSSHVTSLDRKRVNAVLSSGQFSPGMYCNQFENGMAALTGRRYGIFVNSGTDALRIALLSLKEKYGWNDGDYVAVPSVTFIATANIVLQAGMVPLFVDVGMYDYNLNAEQLDWRLRTSPIKKVRAVIPVHLFGQCADMPKVMEVARKYDLKVLEDSCETVGAQVDGLNAGSWGDIACFSTYQAHILATGIGGIAVTDSQDLNLLMRSYANHGRDASYIPGHTKKVLSKEVIAKRFRFVRNGYSCRPSEFEAALGLGQLERLEDSLFKRRLIAIALLSGLDSFEGDLVLPRPRPGRTHSYMMFPIVIRENSSIKKPDLVWHLEKNGIETRDMMPLISQPVYKNLVDSDYGYDVAKWINKNGFYIPCHFEMKTEDVEHIVKTFKKFFAKH